VQLAEGSTHAERGLSVAATETVPSQLELLRADIPEPARDIRLNLQSVLAPGELTPAQRWGVAVASAAAARNPRLQAAVIADARAEVDAAVIDDGLAAAALMAMNNVFYRFRHLCGNAAYLQKPARLRMNRIAKPATSKLDFELFCLAASAIGGCGTCMEAHEKVVVAGGVTEDQVLEAIRIAATVNAAAVALEMEVVQP
jgi:lipoyl-dependent peroxiredoxin subunit D